MAKNKTLFFCKECGGETAKWAGKCPACGAWNSLTEAPEVKKTRGGVKKAVVLKSTPLTGSSSKKEERMVSTIGELDAVLGGGVVTGSLTLLGGDPGIGKSTLLLQLAHQLAKNKRTVLYASAEESVGQVGARAQRLHLEHEGVAVVSSSDIDGIISLAAKSKPDLLIIDSIQTVSTDEVASTAGSPAQVRESTVRLLDLAKGQGIATMIVGHITKAGEIAGPKMLEHMVDTVLYLEGEESSLVRLLRSYKNRFGPTDEVGLFTMGEEGMVSIDNPAELFFTSTMESKLGSALTVMMEGSRPLLVEIQALTNYTTFGYPRRASVGLDANRLHVLIAVLSKYCGLKLSSQDVYLSVAGGFRPKETAVDLAAVAAIYSSSKNKPLPSGTIVIGEVGLSGEVRSVPLLAKRLTQAEKSGLSQAIIPDVEVKYKGALKLVKIKRVEELSKVAG